MDTLLRLFNKAKLKVFNTDKDVVIHEGFNRKRGGKATISERYSNDIALIRINEAIPLHQEDPTKSLVEPICLPWSKSIDFAWNLKEQYWSINAGWGRTDNTRVSSRNRLLKYKVNVEPLQFIEIPIANEQCGSGDRFTIDPKIQICAGGVKGECISQVANIIYFCIFQNC